jgi:hypothetical protein
MYVAPKPRFGSVKEEYIIFKARRLF